MEVSELFALRTLGKDLVIELPVEGSALSSAPFGGGLRKVRYVVYHTVPKDYDENPEDTAREVLSYLNLPEEKSIVFLTAVNVPKNYVVKKGRNGSLKIAVIATVGLSNPAGVSCSEKIDRRPSTINLTLITNGKLSTRTLVEVVEVVVESKVSFIRDLDLRCKGRPAFGTSTDAVAIISLGLEGEVGYAGQATDFGKLASKLVYEALESGASRTKFPLGRGILDRLEERGISVKDLVATALELFIPWEELDLRKAEGEIEAELKRVASDPNVASLLIASMKLDDEGFSGNIPGMDREEFSEDPVRLLADEILGMAISIYLNGWKGLFEYYRYDSRKPGVISKLPPFLDDAVSALIGGVTSRVYSRFLER